jgi:hypothetical protein
VNTKLELGDLASSVRENQKFIVEYQTQFYKKLMVFCRRKIQFMILFQKSKFIWKFLNKITRKSMCISSTSGPIECVFSQSDLLMKSHRSSFFISYTLKKIGFFSESYKFRIFAVNDFKFGRVEIVSWFSFRILLSSVYFSGFRNFGTKLCVSSVK